MGTLVAVLVIAAALLPSALGLNESVSLPSVDPVPLLKLLNDALSEINAGNYSNADSLISIALSTSINDSSLASVHKSFYSTLHEVNGLLESSENVLRQFQSMPSDEAIREVQYDYSMLSLKSSGLKNGLSSYISSLSKYSLSNQVFKLYSSTAQSQLSILENRISVISANLEQLYMLLSMNKTENWLNVSVSSPQASWAGDEVKLVISVFKANGLPLSSPANISVALLLGGYFSSTFSTISNSSTFSYSIKLPNAGEIEKYAVEGYVPTQIFVKAEAKEGGRSFEGVAIAFMKVEVSSPKIDFLVQPQAQPNSNITIEAISEAEVPINVSVYIDRLSPSSNVLNTTIYPGKSELSFLAANISVGFHSVIIASQPSGKYRSSLWSYGIAIGFPPIQARASTDKSVVIGPPFSLLIRGSVLSQLRGNYTVTIYLNGAKQGSETLSQSEFSYQISIPLSSSLLIAKQSVEVLIASSDPIYSPSKLSLTVYSINIITTSALSVLVALAFVHPKSRAIILGAFGRLPLLGRIASIASESASKASKAVELSLETRYRRFKLKRLYDSAIKLLSKLDDPPRSEETLWEYLSRIKGKMPKELYEVVERLFLLFELDLYSSKEVNIDEAKRLFKSLQWRMRNEA